MATSARNAKSSRPPESIPGTSPDGLEETFPRNEVLTHLLSHGKLTQMEESGI